MAPITTTKKLMAPEGTPGGSFSGKTPLEVQKQIRVLHVEDNGPVRKSIAMSLERRIGAKVTSADGYESAIGIIKTDKNFDAVVLDLQLENGHTGAQIFWELPKELQAKVIFFTGGGTDAELQAMAETGRPFIEKSGGDRELVAKIKEIASIVS